MTGWHQVLTRCALWGVPRHLRESVLGDVIEAGGGALQALAIAMHFQAEPYRAGPERRAAAMLALAAAGVLWIVPMAAQSLLEQAASIGGAFAQVARPLWGAPALVAAVACGLLVGRASLLPPHADAARAHQVLLLMPAAAFLAPSAWQALACAAALPVSAWVAHENRRAADDQVEFGR